MRVNLIQLKKRNYDKTITINRWLTGVLGLIWHQGPHTNAIYSSLEQFKAPVCILPLSTFSHSFYKACVTLAIFSFRFAKFCNELTTLS